MSKKLAAWFHQKIRVVGTICHLPSNSGCVFADVFFLDLDFVEEHGDVGVIFTETIEIVCYFV